MRNRLLLLAGCLSCPWPALAATYTVGTPGSGAQYTQLRDVFAQRNLAPGDVVLVRGGASYQGGVVVGGDDGGAPGNPVAIRWDGQGGSRPLLQGGAHTIKFQQSHHVVLDGFEVTGGTSTCVFYEADDITVRNTLVRDCPAHGILGADYYADAGTPGAGSFTLEYSEIRNAGAGATKHPLYIQSDEVHYPGAVFRMRHNYVHGGKGGNLLKSRHQRSEIHYNWFEGAAYQEIELIGPDCETQAPGWHADMAREDAELVGNVIVHTGSWNHVVRAGGDLNGRSQGRVRMVNNTIVVDRSAGGANVVYVQLGLESLEMHNNAIFQTGGAAPAIVRENSGADTPVCGPLSTQPWTGGRKAHGSHNWVETGATLVPPEWGITRKGADPGFENVGARLLRPVAGSALVDAGNPQPAPPGGFPFPSPQVLPAYEPPLRKAMTPGQRQDRPVSGVLDVGALESAIALAPILREGSHPLLPPHAAAAANARPQHAPHIAAPSPARSTARAAASLPVAPAPRRASDPARSAAMRAAANRGGWRLCLRLEKAGCQAALGLLVDRMRRAF